MIPLKCIRKTVLKVATFCILALGFSSALNDFIGGFTTVIIQRDRIAKYEGMDAA
jgi:hypothetical protein